MTLVFFLVFCNEYIFFLFIIAGNTCDFMRFYSFPPRHYGPYCARNIISNTYVQFSFVRDEIEKDRYVYERVECALY